MIVHNILLRKEPDNIEIKISLSLEDKCYCSIKELIAKQFSELKVIAMVGPCVVDV